MIERLPRRVAVTGGSGLLGTAIAQRLAADVEVIAVSNSHPLPGTHAIDLLSPNGLSDLGNLEWDAIVHGAAFRSPDFCEDHREIASLLNTEVPAQLAELATRRQARMIHISTDYVFPGTAPPYAETAPPQPVNFYGETKLAAERRIAQNCPEAVILRVPALYGVPPAPIQSTLLEEGLAAATSAVPTYHDDAIIRYPTFTRDIAEVVAFFLGSNVSGIVHAGAPEPATRYTWARAIARLLGRDASLIRKLDGDPKRKARRPMDAHLKTDRLQALGGPLPRGYSDILPGLDRIRTLAP